MVIVKLILYFKINIMKTVKEKIKELVEAINLAKGRKFVEVDLWVYWTVYLNKEFYKATAFYSMNYKEVKVYLEWLLQGIGQ